MVLVLDKDGVIEAPGNPEFYLDDKDYEKLLTDKNFAAALYKALDRKVCIGRLGRMNNGVYREVCLDEVDVKNGENKFGYYEEVGNE